MTKLISPIAQSFIKSRGEPCPDLPIQNDMDGMCQGIKEMFYEVNMTQIGEGTIHMDVHFIARMSNSTTGKPLLSLQGRSPGSFIFLLFFSLEIFPGS